MKSRHATLWRPGYVLALALALWAGQAESFTVAYCSGQNTGADGGSTYSIYMSDGKCQDLCGLTTYAFAVVQGKNCWCSDYIPADQLDTGDCQVDCPGFPDDKCGNPSEGYYGYIALDKSPSGTMGASSSAAAQTSSNPPSSSPAYSSAELTSSEAPQSSSVAAASSTADSTSSSSSSNPTWTPTPMTSTLVKTVSGNVVTQFVTTMPTSPAQQMQPVRKSISGGAIAGAVIGGLVGLALIVAGALFFIYRRRRQEERAASDTEAPRNSPRRNVSTLSKTGLLRSESEKWPGTGSNTVRNSTHALGTFDFDHTDDSGVSPISERRNSRPLFYDQRLNPAALMFDHPNGSHASIITIEDNRDYGRVLGVTNPDPDHHQK